MVGQTYLELVYEDTAPEVITQVEAVLKNHEHTLKSLASRHTGTSAGGPGDALGSSLPLDHRDAFIICYGDSILPGSARDYEETRKNPTRVGVGGGVDEQGNPLPKAPRGERPLEALEAFFTRHLADTVSGIHILPFFPYTSDDGFSIVDYKQVNPRLGSWEDIVRIGSRFRLMADLVLNHCSAKSPWFKGFLAGDPKYRDWFITLPEDTDTSDIARPRAHPLLTPMKARRDGTDETIHVWTTFSEDQVDLNFAHPGVLSEMLDTILYYIEQGIQVIRLDAIAYLWKELGTPSIHHPKTHLVVKFFREVLSELCPWVVLITETNVPHAENLSYFGTGTDEAHMIYQFSLPPLILDAFTRADARHLSTWARTIQAGPPGPIGLHTTYFNFCASHDGIGMLPSHGILSDQEREKLIQAVSDHGGLVSYKSTKQGLIPYELNTNYLSALADPNLPVELRAQKFLASQAILLAMPGTPGIYIHSLLGSENWTQGPEITGANRTINREKLFLEDLERELADPLTLRSRVFRGYKEMLALRRTLPALHPAAAIQVPEVDDPRALVIKRFIPNTKHWVVLGVNTSSDDIRITLKNHGEMPLGPWEYRWLSSRDEGYQRVQ